MRNLLLTAALVLGSFANAGVPDMRPQPDIMPLRGTRTAVLDNMNLDKDWSLTEYVVGASVSMNYVESTLTLTFKVSNCPKGAMCIVPTEIRDVEYSAPIVNTSTDSCGSLIVLAKEDDRPVDGILTEIELKDNSAMTCDIVVPATVVNFKTQFYDRIGGGEVKLLSNFSGGVLQ